MQLSVIIPAYNEETTMQGTLTAVADFLHAHHPASEIIVVDDGSTDATHHVAQSFTSSIPTRVIRHTHNKGKGAAVRTGMIAAHGDYVLFMDADLSADIGQYPLLARALDAGADIAVGSRYLPGSHIAVAQPWFRVFMGRIANGIIRYTLLPGMYDTQCGFKLFKRSAATALAGKQTMDSWSFDMELLILARRLGYRITEVPITWHDSSRKSRFRSLRDIGRTAIDMIRILWRLDYPKKIR